MPQEFDQTMPMDTEHDVASISTHDEPKVIGVHDGETDREGAMAKADLTKLEAYSKKLASAIHDNDQLEAWVQAKITKAADYIATVYHYLEYEMKLSEYGHHLDNSDTLSEGQKMKIKELLAEAKDKMKELKKAQAEKVKEDFDLKKTGDTAKTHKGGTVTKTDKGIEHKGNFTDEPHQEEPAKKVSKAAKSSAEKAGDREHQKKQDKEYKALKAQGKAQRYSAGQKVDEEMDSCPHCGGDLHSHGEEEKAHVLDRAHPKVKDKAVKYRKELEAFVAGANRMANTKPETEEECWDQPMPTMSVAEAKKKGDGNLANNAKPYNKVTRGDVIAGRLGKDEEGGKKKVDETKPSAGLSKEKKSEVVKKAKKGGDIGKPGKNFDKTAKAAGGGEKGKAIAAAAMWKNIKETTAYVAEKKEATKDLPGNQEKIDADHDGKIEKSDLAALRAGKKEKETVKESTDFGQFKSNLKRLLG